MFSLARSPFTLSHLTKIVFRVSNLHCELSTCSLFKQHFTFSAHLPSRIAAVSDVIQNERKRVKFLQKFRSVYFVSLNEAHTHIPHTIINKVQPVTHKNILSNFQHNFITACITSFSVCTYSHLCIFNTANLYENAVWKK